MSSTIEHVDLSAISQRGVKLGYTPDVLTDAGTLTTLYFIINTLTTCAVADLSVMLALMASRNGAETMSLVKNGEVHTAAGLQHVDC